MSHPPDGAVGVPMTSPFSIRHVALPSGVHPVSAEPVTVVSGTNAGAGLSGCLDWAESQPEATHTTALMTTSFFVITLSASSWSFDRCDRCDWSREPTDVSQLS